MGTLSEATLQASVPGEKKTYKGQFDIFSLCGSFVPSENNGQQTGGLTLVLFAPDGQIFGGCVAGVLIAKSPVQVTVCSYVTDGREEPAKSSDDSEASPTSSNASFGGMTGANRP
ncbi:AT hook motif domain containing protein, expressed [Datura stramonium]|uniref:AT-hook motif nuclear-localized protein n=1 Tax=Datura stramonium TaxID=4076 RepID=A0ABS8RM65_DATST|nr:AT hook motif domain containing protein, expressed [Datura stramonium]